MSVVGQPKPCETPVRPPCWGIRRSTIPCTSDAAAGKPTWQHVDQVIYLSRRAVVALFMGGRSFEHDRRDIIYLAVPAERH
jgi:hypothetical protein